jgi:hypothetical protein
MRERERDGEMTVASRCLTLLRLLFSEKKISDIRKFKIKICSIHIIKLA